MEKESETTNGRSTFSLIPYRVGEYLNGEYEIIYCSDESPIDSGTSGVIEYIQGAEVKYKNVDLQSRINWIRGKDGQEGGIESVSFKMSRDNAKLGDIFLNAPIGLIKKGRTGIGATTLEITSPRDSIIVVPTRTLAKSKALQSKVDGEDRYGVLYVGGNISGFRVPSIKSYLADDIFPDKKFIVVADSLERLVNELEEEGQDPFNRYFLMVDEIDSYQSDISYRPVLENVIDIYFKFHKYKRCFVSATVGSFSNPLIVKEPVIEVEFNSPAPRDITLIQTISCPIAVVKRIRQIRQEYPDDKIVVAYNSITKGILPIIELLTEEERAECGVLCSVKSKGSVGQHYTEPLNGALEKRISFMTCTYFVGVDLYERYHLISVSDADVPHTLLSAEKLQQIAGRCRLSEGVYSETIIYSHMKSATWEVQEKEIKRQMLDDADLLIDFAKNNERINSTFPKLQLCHQKITTDEIIKRGTKSYCNLRSVMLVRRNIDNELVKSYLNVDSILLTLKLQRTTYSKKNALFKELEAEGHNITLIDDIVDQSDIARLEKAEQKVREGTSHTREEELGQILEQLKSYRSAEAMEQDRITLISQYSTYGATFIERFIDLHKYVPFDVLAEQLPAYDNTRSYEEFKNSVIYWALDESHNFKLGIREYFPLNSRHTGDEIREKMKDMLCSNFDILPDRIRKHKCFKVLGMFCKRSNRIRNRESGRSNLYEIVSYDVNGFDCEPLSRIGADESVRKLFDFGF